jgi:hypothetical protein
MIRFFGPAAILLTLAFALIACESDPGMSSAGAGSSDGQPVANTAPPSFGFQPSKLGGGGGGGGY